MAARGRGPRCGNNPRFQMSEGDRAEVEKFRAYLAERKSPKRIQRRRVKGWRKPDNCVVVSRPSRFGNPFTIKDAIAAEMTDPRSAVTQFYSEWLRVGTEGHWYQETYRIGRQVFDRRRILADLHLLRGKDLACTCPLPEPGQPDHCHAAVLLQLANPTKEAQR